MPTHTASKPQPVPAQPILIPVHNGNVAGDNDAVNIGCLNTVSGTGDLGSSTCRPASVALTHRRLLLGSGRQPQQSHSRCGKCR